MSHNWGPDNSSLPGKGNVWLITLGIVSLLIGFGWGWGCWQTEYTSIQHAYIGDYLGSVWGKWQSLGPLGDHRKKSYVVICWVDISSDQVIAPVNPENASITQTEDRLSAIERHPNRSHRQETKWIQLTPAEMYTWLQITIYEGSSLAEIIQGLLHEGSLATVLTFFGGLYFAVRADSRRSSLRKDGKRRRGAQFTTTRQFNRETK